MLRIVRWTATAIVVVILGFWTLTWIGGGSPMAPLRRLASLAGMSAGQGGDTGLPAGVSLGGPFTLTDQNGKQVTQADFRGKWMMLYFGYTYCPDVCPTELQMMANALQLLGNDGKNLVPVFVTVDPARDTPQVLDRYLKLFSDRFVGLTGSARQIADIAREYRVYYAKVTPKDSSTYLMNHSSFIYLVGPDGRFRALFQGGIAPAELARQLKAKLSATS